MEIVLAGLSGGKFRKLVEIMVLLKSIYQWREAFLQGGQNALATGINTKEHELEKELEAAKIQKLCFPTYGYHQIRVLLRIRYGLFVNHKRVYRTIKENGWLVHKPSFEAQRKKQKGKIPVIRSNRYFQTDMTKIRTY